MYARTHFGRPYISITNHVSAQLAKLHHRGSGVAAMRGIYTRDVTNVFRDQQYIYMPVYMCMRHSKARMSLPAGATHLHSRADLVAN